MNLSMKYLFAVAVFAGTFEASAFWFNAPNVAGVPFYTESSWGDWVIQLTFGLIGAVGVVAWISVLRGRRNSLTPDVR